MPLPEKNLLSDYPVLVVAYDEKARAAIAASPEPFGIRAVPCVSFREAEEAALQDFFQGILVDLATMIKAKDEEKVIAHTLTGIYPTLRVRSMGPILIPMIMAGDAKQERSLSEFFANSRTQFVPRRLRAHKRRELCLPTRIGADRGFTVNLSWGGAFIADMHPERFAVGAEVTANFVTEDGSELSVTATVARIQQWGERRPPGIGIEFRQPGRPFLQYLHWVLKSDKDNDRDRLV